MATESKSVRVPTAAGLLGGFGVVPFLGLAASLPFLKNEPKLMIAHALVAYGATILSFLGGVHWGSRHRGYGRGCEQEPDCQARSECLAASRWMGFAVVVRVARVGHVIGRDRHDAVGGCPGRPHR